MQQQNRQKIEDQLARHEGRKLAVYLDSKGIPTVAIGHNLIANPLPDVPPTVGFAITDDHCDRIFSDDLQHFNSALKDRFPWLKSLDDVRYCVLLNMAWTLGVAGVAGFHRMVAAVSAGEYASASAEMLKSDWAQQVGDYPKDSPLGLKNGRAGRAYELSQQMTTGQWQEA